MTGARTHAVVGPEPVPPAAAVLAGAGGVAAIALLLVLVHSLREVWLALLGCLAVGVLVTSVVTRPRLGRLAVGLQAPVRAVAGQDVEHVVAVRNEGRLPVPPVVLLLSARGYESHRLVLPALGPGASTSLTVRRRARARAVSEEHCVVLRGRDVFGLLSSHRHVHVDLRLLVHPAPVAVPRGLPAAPPVDGADEVVGVRPLLPGERTAVHRRASARRGEPVALERRTAAPARLAVVLGAEFPPAGAGPRRTSAPQAPDAHGHGHGHLDLEPGDEVWDAVLATAGAVLRREAARGTAVALLTTGADGSPVRVGLDRPARRVELMDALASLPRSPAGRAPAHAAAELAAAARWAGRAGHVVVVTADASGTPVCVPGRPDRGGQR